MYSASFQKEVKRNAIRDLLNRGYCFNLFIQGDAIYCMELDIILESEEFEIAEIHFLQDKTDPEGELILYGINSQKYNLKGILENPKNLSPKLYAKFLI